MFLSMTLPANNRMPWEVIFTASPFLVKQIYPLADRQEIDRQISFAVGRDILYRCIQLPLAIDVAQYSAVAVGNALLILGAGCDRIIRVKFYLCWVAAIASSHCPLFSFKAHPITSPKSCFCVFRRCLTANACFCAAATSAATSYSLRAVLRLSVQASFSR